MKSLTSIPETCPTTTSSPSCGKSAPALKVLWKTRAASSRESDREDRAWGFCARARTTPNAPTACSPRDRRQLDYDAGKTTALVLGARYYKRIGGHLLNVLSSVVMPLHKVDYYDEDEVKQVSAR